MGLADEVEAAAVVAVAAGLACQLAPALKSARPRQSNPLPGRARPSSRPRQIVREYAFWTRSSPHFKTLASLRQPKLQVERGIIAYRPSGHGSGVPCLRMIDCSKRVSKNPSVRPEPVEGSRRSSWFDKLTTNGFRRLIRHPPSRLPTEQPRFPRRGMSTPPP